MQPPGGFMCFAHLYVVAILLVSKVRRLWTCCMSN